MDAVAGPQGTGTLAAPPVAFPLVDLFRRYFRMLRIMLAARRGRRLTLDDVGRVPSRVWLSEIDELRHMNNGVYLGLMDHARLDLLARAGVWAQLTAAGIYPVVTQQTITYRKSLQLGQRYVIETRVLGYDERQVYVEQQFVVRGDITARAIVAGRMLRKTGGTVTMAELGDITGVNVAERPVPAWVSAWAAASRLPSNRETAMSDW